MNATDYAIVVGINHYPGISSLRGAENDAQNFKDWLIDPNGGGVPEDRIELILSSQFDQKDQSIFNAKPTVAEIENAFKRLLYDAYNSEDYKLGRRLYLFFSGHGYSFGDVEESAIITADADLNTILSHFPGRQAAKNIIRGGIFEEVILFMDCCRDNYKRILNSLNWHVLDKTDRNVKKYFAFATQWGQKTKEKLNPRTDQHEGLFTRALLKSLRSGMADDAKVTSSSLRKSIIENLKTIVLAEELDFYEPDIDFDPDEEIVFVEGVSNESKAEIRISQQKFGQVSEIQIRSGLGFEVVKSFQTNNESLFDEEEDLVLLNTSLPMGILEVYLPELDEGEIVKVTSKEKTYHVEF